MITSNDISIYEWDLKLDNREILQFSEVCVGRVRDDIKLLLNNRPEELKFIPYISNEIANQAKEGYHNPFLKLMKGDPLKSFISIGGKSCHYVKSCATVSMDCYLPRVVKILPNFPDCFHYGDELIHQVLNEFVRHWKNGRRIIITY